MVIFIFNRFSYFLGCLYFLASCTEVKKEGDHSTILPPSVCPTVDNTLLKLDLALVTNPMGGSNISITGQVQCYESECARPDRIINCWGNLVSRSDNLIFFSYTIQNPCSNTLDYSFTSTDVCTPGVTYDHNVACFDISSTQVVLVPHDIAAKFILC